MAASALVNPFAGDQFTEAGTERQGSLIRGLFEEVFTRLASEGGFGTHFSPDKLFQTYKLSNARVEWTMWDWRAAP